MKKRIKLVDQPEFGAARYLADDKAVAAYLTGNLEADDPGLLAAAWAISPARGMSGIAKSSRINREALYKALRSGSAPRLDTVKWVCAAPGLRLVVQARFGSRDIECGKFEKSWVVNSLSY